MNTTIVARSTDAGYDVWMGSQQGVWYEEEEEEEATQLALFDEVDELALELVSAEGLPFSTAVVEAGRRLLGLRLFAKDWDRHAWIGGNEGAAAF